MRIEARNITKRFNGFTALDDVSLRVAPGELVALLGPSGSGKTTLLRIIAGLEFPTEGQVLFGSEDASRRHVGERRVGFVFQHYALFRHMTVFENVAFGLRVKPRRERPTTAELRERVTKLLRLVQLEQFARRYPSQLSGGQRQRVALARALAIEPRVLLLDEPFGSLDAKVRKELRRWLRQLHDEMELTSVFVTHDQEEALELADRVVVMNDGQIEQVGSPTEVYDHPSSPFIYDFLGSTNVLPGTVTDGRIEIDGHVFKLPAGRNHLEGAVNVYIRPHDLALHLKLGTPGLLATIDKVFEAGPTVRLELKTLRSESSIEVELPRSTLNGTDLSPGTRVSLGPTAFEMFPRSE